MSLQPENKGVEARIYNRLVELNRDCPFHNLLELKIKSIEPGSVCVYIEIKEKHHNPRKIAHGGVAFTLADTAMGLSVRSLGQTVVTLEANINYLQPALSGEIIEAKGKVVKIGKSTTVCEAELCNGNGELIAVSRGTYFNMGKY